MRHKQLTTAKKVQHFEEVETPVEGSMRFAEIGKSDLHALDPRAFERYRTMAVGISDGDRSERAHQRLQGLPEIATDFPDHAASIWLDGQIVSGNSVFATQMGKQNHVADARAVG